MTTVSVCVIVKNESDSIAGMLNSVQPLSEDLIVVDTGSSDDTKQVAMNAGAKVAEFIWNNDFSAARNYSLSLAQGDWILVLDADERLDPSAIPIIKSLIQKPTTAFALKRQHYLPIDSPITFTKLDPAHPSRKLGAAGYYYTSDFRLFPNNKEVKFSGIVHETCEDSLRNLGFAMEYTELLIHHYGPLLKTEMQQQKKELYAELAINKVAKESSDWRNYYQAGAELQALNRHAEAVRYFKIACYMEEKFSPNWRQMGLSLCALGQHLEGLMALKTAFSIDDKSSLNWIALGVALIDIEQLNEAENCFQTVLNADANNELAKKNLEYIKIKRGQV